MTHPAPDDAALARVLTTLVRDVPDFPEPGVVFKDIAPLLGDHDRLLARRRRAGCGGP